tara:strand:+ start:288 stop:1244 length:957 start_codon:yes stop_codon:yes gene_type:complete
MHLPIVDAINDLNGISTFYQLAFDGFKQYNCKSKSDIIFCFNKFSTEINKRNQSKYKFQVLTGYPHTSINDEGQNQAKLVRNKLLSNGAKKIICVLDESSHDDERWHTGHGLQIENYKYILLEMLKNKDLGIIFKPKYAFTLKHRLGDTYELLEEAINTGRCFIYDDLNENYYKTTKTLPIHAAISSDLVIHTHLCSGTAAVETALNSIPTILIDRECAKSSVFYNVLSNDLIYNNWEETILAINENLFSKRINPKFGNWDESVNYFNPFNDKNGSARIGNFLNNLINGFNKKMNRNDIIEQAIELYKKQWGIDKIIF